MIPASSGSSCELATTTRGAPWTARVTMPAAPRSGGDRATLPTGSAPSSSVSTARPLAVCSLISPNRPAGTRESGLTSTYVWSRTVRPAMAVRSASTSSARPGSGEPSNASIVSGRAAMVVGTEGAAPSPAITPAMASTSVGDRSMEPSGWSAVGALTSATTATPRDGASSPGAGGTMRWVTSVARGVDAASCAISSTG